MAVIFFDSFAEYFNNLPRTRLPLHSKTLFYNCVRSFTVSLNFLNSNNYLVRTRRIKDFLRQPGASLVSFVLPFFKWFRIVSPAHWNFFSVASSTDTKHSSSRSGSFYRCPCHPDNNYHDCSSSDNDKKWNLRCTESTVSLPENDTCYKCDLESAKNTLCYVSHVTKGQPPSRCSCEKTSCLPNSKSKKPGRYYKKR